jgi:hypothetical protein
MREHGTGGTPARPVGPLTGEKPALAAWRLSGSE